MKTLKLKSSLLALVMLAAIVGTVVMLLTGCKTVNTPSGPSTVVDAERVARISGTIAYGGTTIYLTKNPNPANRTPFVVAVEMLKAMENAQNWDTAALADALSQLPALQDSSGVIYVTLLPILWDEVAQVATPLNRVELVKLTTTSIRSGIERALARAAPANQKLMRLPAQGATITIPSQ